MMKQLIMYSEIFHSCQGEGMYTGRIGPWIRFFGCNLDCKGFSQPDPTDEKTYLVEDIPDVSKIKSLADLPIPKYGCDSVYSWKKEYAHLAKKKAAIDIANDLVDLMRTPANPDGLFVHPVTGTSQHLHFTGGEPLLKKNQKNIKLILKALIWLGNYPRFITIETNGTQQLTDDFEEYISYYGEEWLFSVSPKLYSASGVKNEQAIKPSMVGSYSHIKNVKTQLKFVVNDSEKCWDEISTVLCKFRKFGVAGDVFLMPVGGTREQQQEVADLADKIIENGYNLTGRLHCYIWGNEIGK